MNMEIIVLENKSCICMYTYFLLSLYDKIRIWKVW